MTELIDQQVFTCTGDITRIKTDAVVNAANSSLLGGGGVDGAIHAAGGPTILAACRQLRQNTYPDGLPPGEAAATPAGKLRCRWVIHTVGPQWRGGTQGEAEVLASAYRNSLQTADQLGCASIAFPSISTGTYGFPKALAAEIAWKTITQYLEIPAASVEKVYLVFFSSKDEKLFHKTVLQSK